MTLNRKHVRPSIPLKWRRIDVGLEALGLLILIGYWVILWQQYPTLADPIPVHFDAKGNADAYGSKASFWAAPKMATALYVLMTIIALFPRYFNYGVVDITAENAEKKYQSAATFIRYLKLLVLVAFFVLSLKISF